MSLHPQHRRCLLAALLAGATLASAAPVASAQPAPLAPTTLAAAGPDNVSADAVIKALYASISGDSGVARDWARFRNLFHPAARLYQLTRAARPGIGPFMFTVEEYISRATPQFARGGFHEVEVHRETAVMGRSLHAWSTYESRRSLKDAAPFDAGINTIQMVSDGTGWWILQIGWVSETPAEPIPAKYRRGAP